MYIDREKERTEIERWTLAQSQRKRFVSYSLPRYGTSGGDTVEV